MDFNKEDKGVPFYLAPMAEISHRAFRELIGDFGGCDLYFSEMISAKAVFSGGPFEKWYIDSAPKPEKLVFQVVGNCPEAISRAAAYLDSLDCAGIDINMGCSAPLIRKKGGGAAWMASVDNAGQLISKVKPVVKKRLSVKLRIGFKEDCEYLVKFCRRLQDEGVELITLHPRLITEKFKRLARWEYVSALKKELKIPVAGNGDVSNADDLLLRANSSCDAVMVGRAAVKMPWIFTEAREIDGRASRRDAGAQRTQREENEEREECITKYYANQYEQNCTEEFLTEAQRRGGRGENQEENHINNNSSLRPLRSLRLCENSSYISIKEIGLRFIELLVQHQPPEFHVSRAKRFFFYFCQNLEWGTNLFNQINREETLTGIEKVWREHFIC